VFVDDGQGIRGAALHRPRLYVRSVPRHSGKAGQAWHRDADLLVDALGLWPVVMRTTIASRAAIALQIGRRVAPHLLSTALLAGLALATFTFWSKRSRRLPR
jgi:hypothetical protein